MRIPVTLACLFLSGAPAGAQAFGSVHCKAGLRQADIDLGATQRRLDAARASDSADLCEAMRIHVLTLDHAKIVYGRCIAEPEREDKVAQADAAAGDFRAAMAARSCGG